MCQFTIIIQLKKMSFLHVFFLLEVPKLLQDYYLHLFSSSKAKFHSYDRHDNTLASKTESML